MQALSMNRPLAYGIVLPGDHGAPAACSLRSKSGSLSLNSTLRRLRTLANSSFAISRLRRWFGVGPYVENEEPKLSPEEEALAQEAQEVLTKLTTLRKNTCTTSIP